MKKKVLTSKICKKKLLNVNDNTLYLLQDLIASYILENMLDNKETQESATFSFDYSIDLQIKITKTSDFSFNMPDILEYETLAPSFLLCFATEETLMPYAMDFVKDLIAEKELPNNFRPQAYLDHLTIRTKNLMNCIAEIQRKCKKSKHNFDQSDDVFLEWLKEKTDDFKKDLDLSILKNDYLPNTDLTYKVLSELLNCEDILSDLIHSLKEEHEYYYICLFEDIDKEYSPKENEKPLSILQKAAFLKFDDLESLIDNAGIALNESLIEIDEDYAEDLASSMLCEDFEYFLEKLAEDNVFDVINGKNLDHFCSINPRLYEDLGFSEIRPYLHQNGTDEILAKTLGLNLGLRKTVLDFDERTWLIFKTEN